MTAQTLVPLIAQGLIPVAWITWIAFASHRSLSGWAVHVIAATAYLLAIALAGLWLILPWSLIWVWAALLVGAATVGAPPAAPAWPSSGRGRIELGLGVAAAMFCGAVAILALRGRAPLPGNPVALTFPLVAGTFQVANGGSNTLVNAHLQTLRADPRFTRYRGQSYAVDLVAVGAWGSRRSGMMPTDPSDYAAFGATVVAPCAGRVIHASDSLSDLPVPEKDRQRLAGNHVILECGGAWVVLGHLLHGSMRVHEGDSTVAGEPLARVGNNGNSDEPHLHIHAQTPGTTDAPLSGAPLPITLGGLRPVRNQRIRVPPGPTAAAQEGSATDTTADLPRHRNATSESTR